MADAAPPPPVPWWRTERPLLGGWSTLGGPLAPELMAATGFAWVCLDQQHGAYPASALVPSLQAVDAGGARALVRVAWNETAAISFALDAGADGAIVPMVDDADAARRAVAAARYPPAGARSWGPVRAQLRTPGFAPASADADVLLLVMVETAAACDAAPEILAVPGVDGIFIGPNDLALSLGEPRTPDPAPAVRERIEGVLEAAGERGAVTGIYCSGADAVARWAAAGFDLLSAGADGSLLAAAAADALSAARAAAGG